MNDSITVDPFEDTKRGSRFLRGTLEQGLADRATGALVEDDTKLGKFHGFYQQDDRDLRAERRRQKLEPAYSFMVRVRMAGGVCTPAQWLALDDLAVRYGGASLRLTTRQTFQFHGIVKRDLKATIRGINDVLLDTIAACGDVNRNVMASANPHESALQRAVWAQAAAVSDHLLPRTRAYHEIWLDGDRVAGGVDEEPLYGATYLPRKFKIAFAIPPVNDVDVYANDLGFIALTEGDRVTAYNVAVGGGMGRSHGEPATYARLASVIGACTPDQVLAVAEQVLAVQRDHGDRGNRKHARLKYTIDDHGVDWFRAEVERRLGYALAPARPVVFTHRGDRHGWREGDDGRWHLTLFIENGRLRDDATRAPLTALREIARVHDGEFRCTPNQNVTVANVAPAARAAIDAILARHGMSDGTGVGAVRTNAMACVALPTCGLAMAESERYLPSLITRIEALLEGHGLAGEAVVIRMTGCPNGCARPYNAEIGLVGKAPGYYAVHLGGDVAGERLNVLVEENADEAAILALLDGHFAAWAAGRRPGEAFGDFLVRSGRVAHAAGSAG